MAEKMLTVSQVADRLGFSLNTIYTLVASGGIEHVRIGSKIRFTPEQLEQFIERQTVGHG